MAVRYRVITKDGRSFVAKKQTFGQLQSWKTAYNKQNPKDKVQAIVKEEYKPKAKPKTLTYNQKFNKMFS